ncbi:hypothetical protein CW707_00595 [Candidatus Bathyarchaeota archaeon]|nr:MAG: hypothetical protein CW707_00595 [Candidatus Bathyarchaeota archaeon]RLI18161.1 MAG: hypothetical protein DRO44_01850 [Candidatus Bathyarchaeota archaeon]
MEKREDAATALVKISKKKEDEVVNEMILWAEDKDTPNIRRTASEGLRDVARKNPEKILPVIEKIKTDNSRYVRKSVAALLRMISKKNPEFVINLCRRWAKLNNKNTKLDNKTRDKEAVR